MKRRILMKNKVLALAIAFNVFAVAPLWAQQPTSDDKLVAQLEERLAQSESKARAPEARSPYGF
jgi:hypothetical protein